MSGRAVEAAGDVDVLLLDKTGTITLGNRMATEFMPAPGVTTERLADAAQLASLADETPEGRSIVVLAKEKFSLRGREVAEPHAQFVPFTAQTRMSGVDFFLGAAERPDWPQAAEKRNSPAAPGGAGCLRPPLHPQRRGGCDARYVDREAACSPGGPTPWTTFPAPAARRWWSPKAAKCSASSISRTSSRAASRNASPSFARWASAP